MPSYINFCFYRSDVFRSEQHFKTLNNTIQRIYDADFLEDFHVIIHKLNFNSTPKTSSRTQPEGGQRNEYWIRVATACYQETFQSQVNTLNFTKNKFNKPECKSNITTDAFSKILTAVNTIVNFKKNINHKKNPTFRVEINSSNVKKSIK